MASFTFHKKSSCEIPESLRNFEIGATECAFEDCSEYVVKPINHSPDSRIIKFTFSSQGNEFIDLGRCRQAMVLSVVKADNSDVPRVEKVGVINQILNSMFKSIDVSLQNKSISTNDAANECHKGYIKTLKELFMEGLKINLESELFFPDTPSAFEETDTIAGGNQGKELFINVLVFLKSKNRNFNVLFLLASMTPVLAFLLCLKDSYCFCLMTAPPVKELVLIFLCLSYVRKRYIVTAVKSKQLAYFYNININIFHFIIILQA